MLDEIEEVLKLNVENNDILLVTLPNVQLPPTQYEKYANHVTSGFKEVLKDKKVKIIVVPAGTYVELIKSSSLDDIDA